jgi:hypothetical protein
VAALSTQIRTLPGRVLADLRGTWEVRKTPTFGIFMFVTAVSSGPALHKRFGGRMPFAFLNY